LQNRVFSKHTQWYWFIVILEMSLGILLVLPEIFPFIWIRYVLGAIFVLYLPGYTIVRVLYTDKTLDLVERNALSIGLSLSLVPLIGFILDFTPWRIGLTAIISTLMIVVTGVSTFALYQQLMKDNAHVSANEDTIYTENPEY
jgi:uncharacterized membrane protein